MFFPLTIGLYTPDGRDLTPTKSTLIISKKIEEFSFITNEPVIPSLNQGFSAPVNIEYDYTQEDLGLLLTIDKDNFNRFDSLRRLTLICVKNILCCLREQKEPYINRVIIDAYRVLLNNNKMDKRYLSTLLYIPEVQNIVASMEIYDYPLAVQAKNTYIKIIAQELKGELFRIFENNLSEYELTREGIGKRTLKNKAINILSFLEDDIKEIAYKQFTNSDNMTDYLGAFIALQKCDSEIRIRANKEFYEKWGHNFLVMNKWFAILATRDSDSVISQIEALSRDKLFDKTNPNRIRSLYGAFSKQNLAQFHRRDGEGYKIIANAIIEIDSYNSHASSNLATSFQTYKYLDKDQAELMKAQLERIACGNHSSGLLEIINKTLNARDN
jgi:aminopeptidase N